MTPADRDRAVRVVSAFTATLGVAALGATGITTALAARATQQRSVHRASVAAARQPAPGPVNGARPKAVTTHRASRTPGAAAGAARAAYGRATTAPAAPKPRPATQRPKPPPTTTSGS